LGEDKSRAVQDFVGIDHSEGRYQSGNGQAQAENGVRESDGAEARSGGRP
jgi:hypothetical protein